MTEKIRIEGRFKRIVGVSSEATEPERIIAGYASVPVVDNHKTIFTVDALKRGLEEFKNRPILRYLHETPIGRVLFEPFTDSDGITHETHVDDNGLYVVARIANGTQAANEAWALIEQEIINGFSIGGQIPDYSAVKEREVNGEIVGIIDDFKLFEISVVDLPSNPKAEFKAVRESEIDTGDHAEFNADIEALYKRWSWDACVSKMKSEGYSNETANKICAAIKNSAVHHITDLKLMRDNYGAVSLLAEKIESDPVFDYLLMRFHELETRGEKMSDENRQGADNAPAETPPAPAPAPAQAPQEGPTLDERVAALETEVANIEGAISELKDMVASVMAAVQDNGNGGNVSEGAEIATTRARKGAAIAGQSAAPLDMRTAKREDLLKALDEAEKGRW